MIIRSIVSLCVLVCVSATAWAIEPSKNAWHEFRGDAHDGTALDQNPPLSWGEDKHMAWKTPIHGRGWSSPVVADDQIWTATATEDGKKMYAICVSLATGKIIHDVLLFENEQVQPDHHATNSYASPTPVVERQVCLHTLRRLRYRLSGSYFGSGCLAATRPAVQSLSWTWIITDHLQEFVDLSHGWF